MTWIFSVLMVAAILHVVEEYIYPGGFTNGLKRLNPESVHLITPFFTITINGVFLLSCAIAAALGEQAPMLGLSVAGLIFINAVLHISSALLTGVLSRSGFCHPVVHPLVCGCICLLCLLRAGDGHGGPSF